jgi:hypothetical protein
LRLVGLVAVALALAEMEPQTPEAVVALEDYLLRQTAVATVALVSSLSNTPTATRFR